MFLFATEYLWHSRQSHQMHVRVSALRIKDSISLVGMLYRCVHMLDGNTTMAIVMVLQCNCMVTFKSTCCYVKILFIKCLMGLLRVGW